MILLQKQNINHSILSYKTLIEFSFHIGNLKKIRNNNNANFIINTPQKIDLINQTYTLLIFRKILLTITRIIENHGQILTIIPSTNLLLKIISQHIYITN